ncbi:MAG: hypothetical protein ACREPE_10805 [Lysobacter sp.]
MNIQKLEAGLEEMRVATFIDAEAAADRARHWADRIGDAVTEHLIAGLGPADAIPAATLPELAVAPGGHDWDAPGI